MWCLAIVIHTIDKTLADAFTRLRALRNWIIHSQDWKPNEKQQKMVHTNKRKIVFYIEKNSTPKKNAKKIENTHTKILQCFYD